MATPKIIPYTVKLRSVVPEKTFSKPPVVYTNDLRSAEFQFKITDMDASELLTATAKTMLYMRDGSFFQNPSTDVSRVGNVFSYLLKENEGNHAGIAKIQLVVYFNEGLANEQNFPTQLYEFEIINGLETKVAQEVMIYDWTTLTRDARAYIDQFVADELLRDAEFDNNEFDRNTAFQADQTTRTNTFTQSETDRTTAFNTAEDGRALAETNRVTAETGRTTAETNRVTAETNRATAESGRVTAESGRAIAENTRATTFVGYNARITGVEADVNANATNIVTNGDFSNGTTGWSGIDAIVGGVAEKTPTATYQAIQQSNGNFSLYAGKKIYVAALIKTTSPTLRLSLSDGVLNSEVPVNYDGVYAIRSMVKQMATATTACIVKVYDIGVSGWSKFYVDNILAIDLTATFGKGNEPTTEQMDGILAKFTNSWFDGTKNLFRANATLNKLMAVDARTEFEAKNGVVNGDFSKGTLAPWNGYSGAFAFTNPGKVIVSPDTTTMYVQPAQDSSIPAKNGNKIYARTYIKSSANATSENLMVNAGATQQQVTNSVASINLAGGFISGIVTLAGQTEGRLLKVYVSNNFASTAIAATSQFEFGYVTLIDLTVTFGAGKEPTLAEMDRLMARFPNSWFDGLKPIQTIETLYQEKANKVQEAWITPTVSNGWVATNPIGFYKDEMGVVRLKGFMNSGTIDTKIFTLPVGYRPLATKYCSVFSNFTNDAIAGKIAITPSGDVIAYKYNANMSLDGISFRAEQ